ncbi:MAG: transposase [Solirubrobacteraceae bacterium]
MDADLELLLTTVFVTADDLLPESQKNAARRVTDAEVVTLCVAQAIMGIPSDRRFLAVAGKRLGHLFPALPQQPGYFKRRRKLAETLEWLMGVLASQSPGFHDDLMLIDSTPVECARSRETVKRSGTNRLDDALGNACDYGYCASHSRYFWGMRLHVICGLDGTPRALELCSPKVNEREVGLVLLDRCRLRGGETLIGDKGYAGRDFAAAVKDREVTLVRPLRRDETRPRPAGVTTPALRPAREITPNARAHHHTTQAEPPHLAPIRQRVESIIWTAKDILALERHGTRTLQGLRERIIARFCCLAAAITLNHQLGRPSRELVNYCA